VIDLRRPRDVGELLSTTFTVFGRRWQVFLPLTFVIVAPVILLLDGVWGGVLANGPRAHRPVAQQAASMLLLATVVPATVTGFHCVVVAALGDGRRVGVGEAVRGLAPRLPAALGAAFLYIGGVCLGFLALLIPGIWLAIRWYFAVQSAVLEDHAPAAALRRSAELVDGSWWRVLGLWLAMSLITSLLVAPASGAGFGDDGRLWVIANVLAQTIALSLTAIYGTLMFFDLRARRDAATAAPGHAWAEREFTRPEWLPPQPPPVA
jgi:hypothetical protein